MADILYLQKLGDILDCNITCNKIYGVDLRKKITSEMVRDAIIDCFFFAHKEVLNKMDEFFVLKDAAELEKMKKNDVKALIQATFDDVNGDFDRPTKKDLIKVVGKLKKFSARYRSPEIINKHAKEIMVLINKL